MKKQKKADRMARLHRRQYEKYKLHACSDAYSNALGIDTWASQIVLEKKKTNPNLILEIAQPYEGHNERRKEIKPILEKADLVHPVSTKERRNDAYLDCNKYMVDKSDFVVAIFDDSDPHTGGTWNTLDYAMRKGKIVIKIQWRDIR